MHLFATKHSNKIVFLHFPFSYIFEVKNSITFIFICDFLKWHQNCTWPLTVQSCISNSVTKRRVNQRSELGKFGVMFALGRISWKGEVYTLRPTPCLTSRKCHFLYSAGSTGREIFLSLSQGFDADAAPEREEEKNVEGYERI